MEKKSKLLKSITPKTIPNYSNDLQNSIWNNFNKYNYGVHDGSKSINNSNNQNDQNDQHNLTHYSGVMTRSKRKLLSMCDTNDVNNLNNANNENNSNIKKRKIINEYVSASTVKNYLLQDPILDWFEEYGNETDTLNKLNKSDKIDEVCEADKADKIDKIEISKNINQLDKKIKIQSKNMLFLGGNMFESKINNYLKEKIGENLIEINNQGRFGCNRDNYKKTFDAMMKGYHVILQGVVFNDLNKTYGTFDLIVRSDIINNIVKRSVIDQEMEKFKAPKLSGNYHYIVIDIKWTTMTLCSDGYNIRNEKRFPSYKGQLAIYNCAVGNMQGYIPQKAYIMSKAWKIDKKNNQREGYDFLDLLGEIDYANFDNKYVTKTIDAIGWIRTVRRHGNEWDLYNPICSEMYPNCSNKLDSPWTKEKNDIAEKIHEITNVWNVSVKHRKNAHEKGIKSWKDVRCTSQYLGLTNKTGKIVDEILKINRNENSVIMPKQIKNNSFNWKVMGPTDFYIDFETANCCFGEKINNNMNIHNSKTQTDIVFMIGVGHIEKNEFIYKVFCANDLSITEEGLIFDSFSKYLVQKIKDLDPKLEYVPRLFHWGFAEQTNTKHVNLRHFDKYIKLFNFCQWVDMYKIFVDEPIVVKGSLDFKLKHIGKAMFENNLIKTTWESNGPSDGLIAMMTAIECYEEKNVGTEKYKSIINYNMFDCNILWEIVNYLRTMC